MTMDLSHIVMVVAVTTDFSHIVIVVVVAPLRLFLLLSEKLFFPAFFSQNTF